MSSQRTVKPKRDYAAICHQYATDVVAGRVVACVYVIQACKRHLFDLSIQSDSEGWRFDPDLAARACNFIELLPHTQGKWAQARQKVVLEPWQIFIVANLFGWVDPSGLRRYRYAYIEVPRKNGKSTLLAGIGLYAAFAEGEQGAQVYSAATTRDQARIVWEESQRMVNRLPRMQSALGVKAGQGAISCERSASTYKPLSRDQGGNQDGLNVHVALVDELHAHKSSEMLDVLSSATGAREQPLVIMISTAGFDLHGVCYTQRQTVLDILGGKVSHDRMFGIVYTIDENDDYFDPESWKKANPNYGVSVSSEMLQTEAEKAKIQPLSLTNFLTKHLDVWVNAQSAWLNMSEWSKCADKSLKPEQFASDPLFMGLDLASKSDLAGKIRVFCREIEGEMHYFVFSNQYINEFTAQLPDNRQYLAWAREGWLTLTVGNVTDFGQIEDDIRDDAASFDLREVGFDPWNAAYVAQRLQSHGVECVEVPQRVQFLSESMKWIQEVLIPTRRIHHNGDPVLSWALSNVEVKQDNNGNIFPRKSDDHKKIDPAVALIIAMARAIHFEQVGDLATQSSADFDEYIQNFVSVRR